MISNRWSPRRFALSPTGVLVCVIGCSLLAFAIGDKMSDLTRGEREVGKFGRAPINVPPRGAAAKGAAGIGEFVSVLQFMGKRDVPETVYVSLNASGTLSNGTPIGPLTGRCEFGSGHAIHEIEFDVPVNGVPPGNAFASQVLQGGGTTLAVPATAVNCKVRNDGALIPPIGDAPLGIFGNFVQPAVSASMGVGNRPSSLLTRTIWAVNATVGNGLANNANVVVPIPPYAKRVYIGRSGPAAAAPAITLNLNGVNYSEGGYAVAAGVQSPEFPVGNESFLTVINSSGAEILGLSCVFFLGL